MPSGSESKPGEDAAELDEYDLLTREGQRRAEGLDQKQQPYEGALITHFCHAFPGLYLNPAWPTDDNIIPYKLFYLLVGTLNTAWAMDRLQVSTAIIHARAVTHADKKYKAKRAIAQLEAQALPMKDMEQNG